MAIVVALSLIFCSGVLVVVTVVVVFVAVECNFLIFPLQVVKEGSGSAANDAGNMAILTFLVYSRSRLKTAWKNFTS